MIYTSGSKDLQFHSSQPPHILHVSLLTYLIISSLEVCSVHELFRLTCSLYSVHCSLLPEQGKSAEVYFISEHSFMVCATQRLQAQTSVTSYTSDIYNFNSRLAHLYTLNGIQIRGVRGLELRIADLHTACLQVVLTSLFIKARCRLLK